MYNPVFGVEITTETDMRAHNKEGNVKRGISNQQKADMDKHPIHHKGP